MLQSEFYERTKVNLTGEEYADVEFLYMNIEMNKDEFCKQWLKNRSNKLFQQVSSAYVKDMKRKNDDVNRLYEENKLLKAQLEEKDRVRDEMLTEQSKKHGLALTDFTKRVVLANEESKEKVYDTVEEECGIAFIIRTKHEAGITLTEEEIKYMGGKL